MPAIADGACGSRRTSRSLTAVWAPSGIQFAIATTPPGRVTRSSSAAVRCGSGANIAPKADSVRSKAPSGKGRSCASASTHSTASPRVRLRPSASMAGARSDAVTSAPAVAAAAAALPVPAATSSTRSQGATPAAATSTSAAGCKRSATRP